MQRATSTPASPYMEGFSSSTARRIRIATWTEPQLEFWDSPARFRLFVGGIGSGKTRAGVIECLRMPARTRGMVVAPTYPMLRDATLVTFLEIVREAGILRSYNKGDMTCTLQDDKVILFRSGDDPDRLRGPNLDWFYLDEAAQMVENVWLVMIGRLRGFPGRGWASTTPAGYNWLYTTFVQGGSADYAVTHSSTKDNWFLPTAYVTSLLDAYDEFWMQQEVEGKFVDIGGSAVFNQAYLRALLEDLKDYKPLRRYRDGQRHLGGSLEIYQEKAERVRYIVTADVASGANSTGDLDYSTAEVYREDTWDHCASYWGRPDPDLFGEDLATLSTFYNDGLLIVERNEYGHAVLSTLRDQSANIYRHDPEGAKPAETDDITRDGFPTTPKTKAMVDGSLQSLINQCAKARKLGEDLPFTILNPRAINELLTYHNLPGKRRGAVGRCKDDHCRSVGLAAHYLMDRCPRYIMPARQIRKPGNVLASR